MKRLSLVLVFVASLTMTLYAQLPINVLNPASDLSGKTIVTAEGNRTISGTFTYSVPAVFATGTTGAPGIVSSADTTTGWVLSAGSIAGSLGGVQRFLVNASGLTIYGVSIVDNTGSIATTALGTGVANSGTFLRGDRTWQVVATNPSVVVKAISYAAVAGDYVVCNGGITITLPAASANAGKVIDVKNNNNGSCSVARTGADLIDNTTSDTVNTPFQSKEYISDGTSVWYIR